VVAIRRLSEGASAEEGEGKDGELHVFD